MAAVAVSHRFLMSIGADASVAPRPISQAARAYFGIACRRRGMAALQGLIAAFVGLMAAVVPAGAGEDLDWTAVTVAADGSWGVATADSQSRAISAGIRNCRAMSIAGSDCGAEFTTIRSGWTLALRCGDYRILVAAKTLEDAEAAALNREIDLQLFHIPDLPPCRRVLTVGPGGTATTPKVTVQKEAEQVEHHGPQPLPHRKNFSR
jgi:hypothetical protein